MKKLIVLVAALLLVSMVVAASDVTVGGKISYRWMQDIENMVFYDQATKERVETKINATVDDYNTLAVTLRNAESGDFSASVHRANFTTDIGAVLGLPVGVTLKTGFDEYKASPDKSFVNWGEYEDVLGTATKAWGQKIEIAAHEYVNLVAFWAYSTDFDKQNWGAGVNGTVSMVTYEAALLGAGKEEIGEGNLEIGLSTAMDVADGINVAGSLGFDYLLDAEAYSDEANWDAAEAAAITALEEDSFIPSEWQLGVGVKATYNEMASLGIGYKTAAAAKALALDKLGSMQVDLWAMPIADQPLELLVAIGLALDDTVEFSDADDADAYQPSLFNSLEVSAKYKFGAAEFYLGYLYTGVNTSLGYTNADGDAAYKYWQVAKEKAAANLIQPLNSDGDGTDAASGVFMRMELAY